MARDYDLTITTGKRITITWGNGEFILRNGNFKNFSTNTSKQYFYFNPKYGTDLTYEFLLKYSDLATVSGATAPDFATVKALIIAEFDAEA